MRVIDLDNSNGRDNKELFISNEMGVLVDSVDDTLSICDNKANFIGHAQGLGVEEAEALIFCLQAAIKQINSAYKEF